MSFLSRQTKLSVISGSVRINWVSIEQGSTVLKKFSVECHKTKTSESDNSVL